MSWALELAEARRKQRAADAEQARLNADAASVRRVREQEATAARIAQEKAVRAELAEKRRAERAARRAARWQALRAWLGAHRVDLLIYPLAVASAVLAVPAMAAYGIGIYGAGTGIVLPVLSELGMWAFALAVQLTRRMDPERPVWALRAGVVVFAALGFVLNLVHGLATGVSAGLVMGTASIAGVVAHQLVTAGPRATATERREARHAARLARKQARVRRAAVAQSVTELDGQGSARVVFTPGHYTLTRPKRRVRRRLVQAVIQPAPEGAVPVGQVLARLFLAEVAPPGEAPNTGDGTGIGDEAEAWLATHTDASGSGGSGPVSTLDPTGPTEPSDREGGSGADLHESTPDHHQTGKGERESGRVIPSPSRRSIADLRRELADVLATDPDSVDVSSAESIRHRLRCSAKRARQLRDEQQGGSS
ncbi:hypothetical protein [Sciscionella sediminilitoris]|uniref:hypothetical protein n=1 Tax=Sciscionella sediminilitoris TaxID=1445613 RepID=UPI0004DFB453|nr:hypothetical protein [Sciscionella sp. SE31]